MIPSSVKAPKAMTSRWSVEPSSKRLIRVALVEAKPKVRESWRKLVSSFAEFACSCVCTSAEEALITIPLVPPDVVLMDILLPQMSGIECIFRLKESLPNVQVIVFTEMDYQKSVFRALEAGADGYLLKRTKSSDLRTALLEVLHGGAPMTSQIARCVITSFRPNPKILGESIRLTPKENQILKLLSQGYANNQIGYELKLSINTVCCHLKHVFKKLQVSSRTEAAVCYLTSKNSQPKPVDSLA